MRRLVTLPRLVLESLGGGVLLSTITALDLGWVTGTPQRGIVVRPGR